MILFIPFDIVTMYLVLDSNVSPGINTIVLSLRFSICPFIASLEFSFTILNVLDLKDDWI